MSIPPNAAQASGCQLRGQSCYVEVTLGFPGDKGAQLNPNISRNAPNNHPNESFVTLERDDQKHGSERTFIYPAEAVMVPVIQTAFARSSLKRYLRMRISTPDGIYFHSFFLLFCLAFRLYYWASAVIQKVLHYNDLTKYRFWLQNWAGASLFGSCFLVNWLVLIISF